jgi:hypothetical protein
MEDKRAHLEMLQAVVSRMSANSFLLKGWSVTLVSALFALAASQSQAGFIQLAFLPALAFWALDAFFVRQERLFRALFDRVRQLPNEAIDFAMDTQPVASTVASWRACAFSATVLPLHLAVLGAVVLVMWALR